MSAPPLLRSRVSARTVLRTLKRSFQLEKPSPHAGSRLPPSPSPRRRILSISRLPVESTSCLVSMLPLHSAIAAARLRSVLAAESQSWGLIPQGPKEYRPKEYHLVLWEIKQFLGLGTLSLGRRMAAKAAASEGILVPYISVPDAILLRCERCGMLQSVT